MSKLTGRRRFRAEKRFMRRELLVLQVEIHSTCWNGGSVDPCLKWRDAAVEDLMTIDAVHKPFPLAK